MDNPHEQSPIQLLRRIKKAIVSFEAIGEKNWYTKTAELWGLKLLEIVMAFTMKIGGNHKRR